MEAKFWLYQNRHFRIHPSAPCRQFPTFAPCWPHQHGAVDFVRFPRVSGYKANGFGWNVALIPMSILTILSLSAASYSITPSIKADRLWSLWTWILFYYFFKMENHLWAIPRATIIYCTNMWRNSIGSTSGRRCHFVFCVHPTVEGHLWKPSRQKSPMMRATKNWQDK